METKLLFRTSVLVWGLFFPILLVGQNDNEESSLLEVVGQIFTSDDDVKPDKVLFEKFTQEFPKGKLPYEISVESFKNMPKKSKNKEIEHDYGMIYHSEKPCIPELVGKLRIILNANSWIRRHILSL